MSPPEFGGATMQVSLSSYLQLQDRSLTATTTIQNRDPKILDSFADIADGAARAQEVCADKDERDEDLVNGWAGQAFHRTNWNVIVARC